MFRAVLSLCGFVSSMTRGSSFVTERDTRVVPFMQALAGLKRLLSVFIPYLIHQKTKQTAVKSHITTENHWLLKERGKGFKIYVHFLDLLSYGKQ